MTLEIKDFPLAALRAAHLVIQLADGAEEEALLNASGGNYCGGCEVCGQLESQGVRALRRVQKVLEDELAALERK